jgi:hypothetical protein
MTAAVEWLGLAQKATEDAEARGYETVEIEIGALRQLLQIAIQGRAVVARWDTPLWKNVEATGVFIDRLRDALAEPTLRGPPGSRD